MSKCYSFISWNINGSFIEKLPILSDLSVEHDVVCIQEHFITVQSENLLELNHTTKAYKVPAKQSCSRGRPSGGLATFVRSCVLSSLFEKSENFLAVRIESCVFINVYLATDYKDERLERLFALSCEKLNSCISKIKRQGFSCVVIGDFNCNLSEISSLQSSRTSLIKNLFGDYLAVVGKDRDFTYIHSSSSVSNLDHVAISHNLTVQNVRVVTDYQISDHLPVSSSVHIVSSNGHQTRQETQQPKFRLDWLKADKQLFALATEEILNKIRIPFNLLQKPKDLSKEEVRICLNIYCTEICHALLHAERLAVPKVKVRKGMVQKWPENHSLVAACHRAKFWFSL